MNDRSCTEYVIHRASVSTDIARNIGSLRMVDGDATRYDGVLAVA
jgi:hypothetical protein